MRTTADWARACPATLAASCSAADSGRTGSGCIGSIMREPSSASSPPESAISRADPSSGHQARMLLWDAGGCDDGSATRCTCSLALADQLCSEGQKCPVHPNLKGANRPCTSCLARISDTALSVRASDTSSCRYQHPPAPWQTSKGNEPPWYSSRKPKVPPLYPSVHRENPARLIGPDPLL